MRPNETPGQTRAYVLVTGRGWSVCWGVAGVKIVHVPNAFWPAVGGDRKRERERGRLSEQIKLHLQNAKRIVVRATSKKKMEMKKPENSAKGKGNPRVAGKSCRQFARNLVGDCRENERKRE